ncbi:MAG TPA: hypothetical protein VEB86_18785 [Chryseosolibacter sp.]|nr:hypothetical protein [Chryseosolibacter sp.]
MRVKRTKKGNFSIELTNIDRANIFRIFTEAIADESKILPTVRLIKEVDVMRHLYHSVLVALFNRRNFQLQNADDIKWTCTRAEAIALMWALRGSDDNIALLELKSGLHKQLN